MWGVSKGGTIPADVTIGVKKQFLQSCFLVRGLGMSNSLLSIIVLVASLGCALAGFLIHATMITAINSKRDAHSQISCLNRDFLGTFKLHRQLYPDSTLRVAVVLSLGLSVAFGLGFTFIQSLQH